MQEGIHTAGSGGTGQKTASLGTTFLLLGKAWDVLVAIIGHGQGYPSKPASAWEHSGPGLITMGMNLLHRGTQVCSSRRQITEDLRQKACEKGASSLGQRRWHEEGEHQGIMAQEEVGSQKIGISAIFSLKTRVQEETEVLMLLTLLTLMF